MQTSKFSTQILAKLCSDPARHRYGQVRLRKARHGQFFAGVIAALIFTAAAFAQDVPGSSPFRTQYSGSQSSGSQNAGSQAGGATGLQPGDVASNPQPGFNPPTGTNQTQPPAGDVSPGQTPAGNGPLENGPQNGQPQASVASSRTGSAAELRAKITTRQTALQGDASLAAETVAAAQSLFQKTLTLLDEAESRQAQADKWQAAIASAPQRLRNEVTRGEQLNTTETPPLPVIADLEEGKRVVQEVGAALNEVSNRLASLNREEANRVKRKQEVPELISKLKAYDPKAVSEAVPAPADAAPLLVEASQWVKEAEQFVVDATLREYELELQAYTAESALLPLQIENDRKLEARLKQQLRQANTELDALRSDQIESARSAAAQALKSATSEPARKQLQADLDRIKEWKRISPDVSPQGGSQAARETFNLQEETQAVSDDFNEWNERLQNIRSRIEVAPDAPSSSATFNTWIGLKLRNQREELPSEAKLNETIKKIHEELRWAEALQFTLEDEKKELLREKLAIERSYMDGVSAEQLKGTRPQIWELYNAINLSLDTTTQMRQDLDTYVTALIDSATKHADTISLVQEYRKFIDQHILWIRSAQPISLGDAEPTWEALKWVISYDNWKQTLSHLWQDVVHAPWWYAFFIIGMAVLLVNQSSMRRLLGHLSQQAARPGCADFSLTYRCTLLTLAISSPLAVGLLFVFWRLKESSGFASDGVTAEHGLAIAAGCALAAGVTFPLELFRQVCRLNGLAVHHFGWSGQGAGRFRRNLRWFIDLGIPCVGIVGILSAQSDSRREVSLGRVAFILLMMICLVLFLRLFNPRTGVFAERIAKVPDGWLNRTRFAWFGIIICLPAAIAITSIVGYHYTAQRIALHLNSTLWMLVALSIVYCLMSRWLLLNRRKLIVAQARARLVEAAKRDAGESEMPPENSGEVDVVEINEQTKRLMRSLIVTVGIIGGYFIWADVLPAIDILRDVTIWPQRDGSGEITGYITLADALLVIPVVALVVIASRNVPGLLEIALLQHLPLTSAAKYAVTTLCRYVIMAVGIVACCNQLSIRWDTVQWLVAALGVGLGFGLQEIFANFVSGVILLFEQPLRVGDIITIDGVTGTVTKIRMRATTIVNWDRQELIVPNKDLITGKLLNWTLSDSTNRIVVEVGVAYGSDMQHACQVIREICEANETVLGDPPPLITFSGFGDNTLNIVVRAFLSSLDNRLATIHSLHEEIYRQLNKEGIEIAFPQRDLHLRSLPKELANLFGGNGGISDVEKSATPEAANN